MVAELMVLPLAGVFVCVSAVLAGVMGAQGIKAQRQAVAQRNKS